jgi:transposase
MNSDTRSLGAVNTLSPEGAGSRFAGIDWASADHVASVVDQDGQVLWRRTVPHTRAELRALTRALTDAGVVRVGIERPDGPLVQALLDAGLDVAVVPPRQVKNLRSRYRAGKDDRFDAYVLADAMRTDGHRFTSLTPDTAATTGLRALVRARQDLVKVRVGLTNQLRHTLELSFPGAVGLFCDLHSPIARAFLHRFPTPAAAAVLDETAMAAWLKAEGYCGRTPAATFIHRLATAPSGAAGPVAGAYADVVRALLTSIDIIEDQARALERRIREALTLHPDASIFTSLPRAGTVRAAAILAEIGDARGRYPTAEALAAAAGVAPVTFASGKHTGVGFRYQADTKLRRAITDFADDSRRANPWAADIYARARARGMRHPHAVRVLARAWILVIWKCWQTNTPYHPAHHGGLTRHLEQTAAAAA